MLELTRIQLDRTDINKPIRSMSYNSPGHRGRVKAHCKRVAAEFRKYRVIVKIFDILFKRAARKLKFIPKISNKVEIREELGHARRKTMKGIKAAWI